MKPAFAGSPTSLAAGSCGFVRAVSEYYGAFVLDPDGHNIEVVNHNR